MASPQACQASVSRFFRPKKRPCNTIERSGNSLGESEAGLVGTMLDDSPESRDRDAVGQSNATKDAPAEERDVLMANELFLKSEVNGDGQIRRLQHVTENVTVDMVTVDTKKKDIPAKEEFDEPGSAIKIDMVRAGKAISTEESIILFESKSEDNDPSSEDRMTDDTVNPFAQFAFSTGSSQERPPPAKRKVTSKQSTEKAKKTKSKSKKSKDWIRMADCSPEEQERIRIKWHSLADPKAPLQVRRFQIFVAARLHAQCQEPVVRKTMEALREQFVQLNVDALAQCDPEVLAVVLSSVQYYNTKAKHLVTASLEIQSRFQGKVPETEALLRQITGIGPVMADLLAFVNTVKAHT